MSTNTMNSDEFYGDKDKSADQVRREVEQMAADMALGDPGVQHEDRPAGYGTLLTTYEWRPFTGGVGMPEIVRAWCLTDACWMDIGMRVDPRYGKTANKYTKGVHAVEFSGRMVTAWVCAGGCGQWVTK